MKDTHDITAHKIFLFYVNKPLEDTEYLNDFKAGEKENNKLKFIPTMVVTYDSKHVCRLGTDKDRMIINQF